MILRFRDEDNKYRIVDTSKVEIEGIAEATCKNGKWVFTDDDEA